jgi:tetratricopeptide (TPR) repeat protein
MNQPFASAHQDILDAKPHNEAAKARLLEECKDRAKRAIQSQVWPDAIALYQKALECTSDENQQSILHSNLSLAQGKMNRWEDALHSAQSAVDLDATYVKGWWRLGQAQVSMGKARDAVTALQKALSLDPTNKALIKELEKVQKQASDAPQLVASATTKSVTKTTTTSTAKSLSKASSTISSTSEPMEVDVDEEGNFTKSDHVKGYKIVNGKKTSYFHNELSEDAKKLIGDIAPQKLETVPMEDTSTRETGKSAWNKAGTWEEKDVSVWGQESLQESLQATTFQHAEGLATVSSATVSGHASVATVRGKKRLIYEWSIVVHWSFMDCTGKLEFPDVDGTCMVGEPYDATGFTVSTGARTSLVEDNVYRSGLRNALHESIDNWVRLFQEKY